MADADCAGGTCLALSNGLKVCSPHCAAGSDCTSGWTCDTAAKSCQCQPSVEVCDGKDNDCNGIVDDSPQTDQVCVSREGAGSACRQGACACSGAVCDGRCVELDTDARNCGACGAVCPIGASCAEARCQCPAGSLVCDNRCVDILSDRYNCGVCGKECPGGTYCVDGECGCPSGMLLCGDACVDTASDAANCGECGHGCESPTTRCVDSQCVCPNQGNVCGNACVQLSSDSNNCGQCGKKCPAPTTACIANECECPQGKSLCGAFCYDTNTNIENCGTCGKHCASGASCEGGNCQCPAGWIVCNDTCVDPQNDIHFCGGCNTQCTASGGGTAVCGGGTCRQTFVMATGMWDPWNVAIDSTNVYVADPVGGNNPSGKIYSVPRSGGTLKTLASGLTNPTGLVSDGSYVYWVNRTNGGTVQRVPVAGGSVTTMATTTTPAAPRAVAVDASNIYWVENSFNETKAEGRILKLPLNTPGGTPVVLASGQAGPWSLSVSGGKVFWANRGTTSIDYQYNNDGSVMSVPISGGTAAPLDVGLSLPTALVTDSTNVYFMTIEYSSSPRRTAWLQMVPQAGGTTTTLMSGVFDEQTLVLDGTDLYFMASDSYYGGVLERFSLSSGAVTHVSRGSVESNPVMDASSFYWTNGATLIRTTPK